MECSPGNKPSTRSGAVAPEVLLGRKVFRAQSWAAWPWFGKAWEGFSPTFVFRAALNKPRHCEQFGWG